MLKPIRPTDVRLNSLVEQDGLERERKSVNFTTESRVREPVLALTEIAIRMELEGETKKRKTAGSRRAIPNGQPRKKEAKSASSWSEPELELCAVEVQRNVNVWGNVIPNDFRKPDLEGYDDCVFPTFVSSL